MSTKYRDNYLSDRRIRRKDNSSTDDPDWYTNQWDPGTFLGTVASVAAGTLTVQITPVDTSRYPTPDPITVTLTTETAAQAAEAVYNEANDHLDSTDADFDPTLGRYLLRSEYTAAATAARFVPNPDAPDFTVTMTPTGGAMTFTLSPDDIFPITEWMAKRGGANAPSTGEVAITVHAVTSADEMLGVGTCTFDLQVLRVVERYDGVRQIDRRPGVADLGSVTGVSLGEEVRVPFSGGRIGVRLTNVANEPATTDALEVRIREAVT